MTLQPPYALFVTATNLDVDYINTSLTRAFNGNFGAGWLLWVPTSSTSYASAPKTRTDGELPRGTEPPLLPQDFTSPFAGKSLEDCARWLLRAPGDVAVHKRYFTVLDQYSKEEDMVMVVRVVQGGGGGGRDGRSEEGGQGGGGSKEGRQRGGEEGGDGEDKIELEYFPQPTDTIVMEMQTNGGNKFDEKALNYHRTCMKEGRVDRSKGGPWE